METMHTPVTAAKEIKAKLKKLWPNVKFSVRSKFYAGGNSIDIDWNLGPTRAQVEQIVKIYQTGYFDGMTDSYNYEKTLILTEGGDIKTLGGAKCVSCQRTFEAPEHLGIKWSEGGKELWDKQETFFHRVMKDMCVLQGVQYEGQYTKMFKNSHVDVSQCFYDAMGRADLSKGEYAGVEFNPDSSALSLFNIIVK